MKTKLIASLIILASATSFAKETDQAVGQNANMQISINDNCTSLDSSKKLLFDLQGREIQITSLGYMLQTTEKVLGISILQTEESMRKTVKKIIFLKLLSQDKGSAIYNYDSQIGVSMNVEITDVGERDSRLDVTLFVGSKAEPLTSKVSILCRGNAN